MPQNRTSNREFGEPTKLLLGQRVAYICSNPICRRLTIKPHATEEKAVKLGEAAHINGLSPKGPRYKAELDDDYISSFQNGIWLCEICHGIVDSEKSTHSESLLIKWKTETEQYVQSLAVQDSRLRQLRVIAIDSLSSLRILSALPINLDQTFNQPRGNGIGITRLLIELELILSDNEFLEEANIVHEIKDDLEKIIIPTIETNRTNLLPLNISEWKNTVVNVFMLKIMRYNIDAYNRYKNKEDEMVNSSLDKFKKRELIPIIIPIEKTQMNKHK